MQRAAKMKKATKVQSAPNKAPLKQARRKNTTLARRPSTKSLSTSMTAPQPSFLSSVANFALAPFTFTSPFSQQQRFMAKPAGKNDKKGGKSDKKGSIKTRYKPLTEFEPFWAHDASSGPDVSAEGFSGQPFSDKMSSFVEAYENELSNVKVGRATPEMLHDIVVEFGGKKVPLKAIAQVYTKPPASLIVSVHEQSDAIDKAVCNAISGAKMDLNPFVEAVHGVPSIIVPFPKPTKELRESLIKITKSKAEDTKINIRNQRKLWNDAIKKAGLPKDDAYRGEQDCQKQTDKFVDQVSDLAAKKEKEINAV